jgi:hypothetical protein
MNNRTANTSSAVRLAADGHQELCSCDACIVARKAAIRKLERAYLKAHNAEQKAVAALPENAPKAMTDRCWALAAEADRARTALATARLRIQGVVR